MRNDQDERLPKTKNPTKLYEFNLDKQSRSTQANNKIKKKTWKKHKAMSNHSKDG